MLHDLLSRRRDEIIERCERKLRERHPDRPRDELLDSIPAFLDELIARDAGAETSAGARAHAQQRFQCGYAIAELAIDYCTICDAIGEVAGDEHIDFDPRSYRVLNACIDRAIADSISEYFELSREHETHGVATWVGSLGHELRNAVSSALMAFSVLKAVQGGVATRAGRILDRSLHRIESLVQHTLAVVQLKAGRELSREHVDARQLLDDVIAATETEREVAVEVQIAEPLWVDADPCLFESALSNLIQNAMKFTRNGGHVVVRGYADDREVVIDIEDECGGLRGHNPEELFAPFVQREQRSRGVGLGLAITRESIEAHGGTVTCRDQSPSGCVFSVRLPR